MKPRVITEYAIHSPKIHRPRLLAVVSDLHNRRFDDILVACARAEAMLVPGDLIDICPHHAALGLDFLRQMAARMPTYYTYGNHEDLCDDAFESQVRGTGAVLLNNAFCNHDGLVIGGLHLYDKPRLFSLHDRRNIGDGLVGTATRMLGALEQEKGFRLLLSHKPEWFARLVRQRDVDLTVSGHAHGGQIRLFGQGLYAPHQGVLPRWTRGLYEDDRLLVSAGATNTEWVPRIGNPCEILLVRLLPPPA
ncbi:MAG: metallophosphoesterase [Clostridia bacterium]|nr:metallophosphoesterase [Clostridia bacterium]